MAALVGCRSAAVSPDRPLELTGQYDAIGACLYDRWSRDWDPDLFTYRDLRAKRSLEVALRGPSLLPGAGPNLWRVTLTQRDDTSVLAAVSAHASISGGWAESVVADLQACERETA